MNEIEEKYPKVWEMLKDYLVNNVKYWSPEDDFHEAFHTLYGYLVLKFFPKHGIANIMTSGGRFGVAEKSVKKIYYFDTPQEAIEKAFEILK